MASRPEPVPISRTNESGLITLYVWEIAIGKVLLDIQFEPFRSDNKNLHMLNWTAREPTFCRAL